MAGTEEGVGAMLLRVVRVTIAPGKAGAYWSWAKDIVRLWDEAGVRRAGGPYALKGARGEDVALWLTVHESEEQMRLEFQQLYSAGRGKALIDVRPELVAETQGSAFGEWQPGDSSAPPPPPEW